MNKVIQGTVRELEPRYKNLTDVEIIEEVKEGKNMGEAVFYLLFGRYAEMLGILFASQDMKLMDFDDFMLELDIRLFKEHCEIVRQFDGRKASFKTYLSTIARNLLYDLRKKDMPMIDIEIAAASIFTDDNQRVTAMIEAINHLKNKEGRFVMFKTIEGYSSMEIAAMLGNVKPAYVDTLRARAKIQIRIMVEESDRSVNASVPSDELRTTMCNVLFDRPYMDAEVSTAHIQPLPDMESFFVARLFNLYNEIMK